MSDECSYSKIKEGFFLVNHPEIRGNPWYLTRKPGEGTYVEIAMDPEVGVYIAPWPFNKRIVVEQHRDPELRRRWDEAGVPTLIRDAFEEITRQLLEEESLAG